MRNHEVFFFTSWSGERVYQQAAAGRVLLVQRCSDPAALEAVAEDPEVQASVRSEAGRCARLIRAAQAAAERGGADGLRAWEARQSRRSLDMRSGVASAVREILGELVDG